MTRTRDKRQPCHSQACTGNRSDLLLAMQTKLLLWPYRDHTGLSRVPPTPYSRSTSHRTPQETCSNVLTKYMTGWPQPPQSEEYPVPFWIDRPPTKSEALSPNAIQCLSDEWINLWVLSLCFLCGKSVSGIEEILEVFHPQCPQLRLTAPHFHCKQCWWGTACSFCGTGDLTATATNSCANNESGEHGPLWFN